MKLQSLAYKRHYSFCCIVLFCLFSSASLASDKTRQTTLKSIGMEITTHLGDHQTFRKDDIVSFFLSLDRDAYITAIYIDADKNLYQIIPNAFQYENYYKADLFIPIPPQNAEYSFKIKPPYGEETLWVFASDSNEIRLKGNNLNNGMIKLSQTLNQIRTVIRDRSSQRYDESSVHIVTGK